MPGLFTATNRRSSFMRPSLWGHSVLWAWLLAAVPVVADTPAVSTADQPQPDVSQSLADAEAAVTSAVKEWGERGVATADARENLARAYLDAGKPAAARKQMDKVIEIRERADGEPVSKLADSFDLLAMIDISARRFIDSEAAARRAVSLRRSLPDESQARLADSLALHAEALRGRGYLPDAAERQAEAIGAWEGSLGPRHAVTLRAIEALASIKVEMGNRDEAAALIDRVIDARATIAGPDHPSVARSLELRANLLDEAANHVAAKPVRERVVAIQSNAFGPSHPAVAVALAHLGDTLLAAGDREGAERAYERALTIDTQTLGAEHCEVASDLVRLARCKFGTPARAEGTALLEKAATILGGEKKDLVRKALSLHELAHAYDEAFDLANAEKFFKQAVEADKQAFGAEHPETAIDLFHLARVVERQGRYDEARTYLRQVLAIDVKVLGTFNLTTAETIERLADVSMQRGRAAASRDLLRQALAIRQRTFGRQHPTMADIYERLADIEQRDGDSAEAIELLDKAIGVRLQTQGAMHPSIALTLERMADVEEPVNPSAAVDFRTRALAVWERHLGQEHDVTLKAMQRLAECELAAQRPVEAEALLQRALEMTRRQTGEQSSRTAGLLVDLGAAARMQRRNADAKHALNEALEIYRITEKAPSPAVAVCLHRLGEIALEGRQPGAALKLFQQVVAIDESIHGAEHEEVAEDLMMVAAAHAALGKPELADEIRARARAILDRAATQSKPVTAEP